MILILNYIHRIRSVACTILRAEKTNISSGLEKVEQVKIPRWKGDYANDLQRANLGADWDGDMIESFFWGDIDIMDTDMTDMI